MLAIPSKREESVIKFQLVKIISVSRILASLFALSIDLNWDPKWLYRFHDLSVLATSGREYSQSLDCSYWICPCCRFGGDTFGINILLPAKICNLNAHRQFCRKEISFAAVYQAALYNISIYFENRPLLLNSPKSTRPQLGISQSQTIVYAALYIIHFLLRRQLIRVQ